VYFYRPPCYNAGMEFILSHPWLILAVPLAVSLIVWGMRATRIKGRATIVDGDSLEVNGIRCCLAGIDAPKYNQFFTHRGRVQHIGVQARKALTDLINNQPVICKVLGEDSYKRQLVVCYNHKGQDVGRALVLMGLAEVYGYRTRSHAKRYRFAQFRARFARRGLWATSGNSPQAWRQVQ
jgi:endonuclease YncB( thermonuclease family)